MFSNQNNKKLDVLVNKHPKGLDSYDYMFSRIHRGDRIFIGTGCGEPQYLVNALIKYVGSHPNAFFDAEVFHVWTFGVAPYTDAKFKQNFRHNSFFIGDNTRGAVNKGLADYTPLSFSQIPKAFYDELVPIDVALIQTSPPDEYGYMSLGISVDITKAAVDNASMVIAQINSNMPRVHGDTFIHVDDVDFIVQHDEPLLEYKADISDEIAQQIGQYVARIVQDYDTIQVGYGSIPNAVLYHLKSKRHLGVHTELLGDGIVELMRKGVIDNTGKSIDRGKTIATFSMGCKETYEFLHDNPGIEFRTVDYTNNPLIIAQNRNMTAINSALQVDLTGQATAESMGKIFYRGIGGSADFMRGTTLAQGGKTILAIQSTALKGNVSRIMPFLSTGVGVTLCRSDVQYVVTEYGIAYIHGKNIRERAMDLIAISHPRFRSWLIEEAKKFNLIYSDQAFISGRKGEYPENFETQRTTKSGLTIMLRPVKISDESLLKDFFYSLSDESTYKRFISVRKDMHHERLQEFAVIDYTRKMVILAVIQNDEKEEIVAVGQYDIGQDTHTAEVSFIVRDDYQKKGIGTELVSYLTYIAKKKGLLGFNAVVLMDNKPMLHIFEKMGFDIHMRSEEGVYELKIVF